MANPERGEVEIEMLGGKSILLRIRSGAAREFEELAGYSLKEFGFKLSDKLKGWSSLDDQERLRKMIQLIPERDMAVLWRSARLHERPRMTMSEANDEMDEVEGDGWVEKSVLIFHKLTEAVTLFLGGPNAKKKTEEALEAARTKGLDLDRWITESIGPSSSGSPTESSALDPKNSGI